MATQHSLTHLLDEAWAVNDLFVTVQNQAKSVHILTEDILTYELMWEDDDVHGVLSFTDHYGILQSKKLLLGGVINISYTSQKGSEAGDEVPFTGTFSITNVIQLSGADVPSIEIQFEDYTMTQSKGIFGSETFEGTAAKNIGELAKKAGFGNVIVAGPKMLKEVKQTIMTPSHKPITAVLGGLLQEHGYKMIIDKFSTYIVHAENLLDQQAQHTGEVFHYKPRQHWIRNQILEYNLPAGYDHKAIQNAVGADTNQIDYKQAQQEKSNLGAKPLGPLSTNTHQGVPTKDLPTSAGVKVASVDGGQSLIALQESINKLQTMSIWIPGWNGQRQGKKITIEMPRPKYENQNENDTTTSGDWVVYKTRDKIISSYFVQELFLRRAGG